MARKELMLFTGELTTKLENASGGAPCELTYANTWPYVQHANYMERRNCNENPLSLAGPLPTARAIHGNVTFSTLKRQ
jgi:hypothetical protein